MSRRVALLAAVLLVGLVAVPWLRRRGGRGEVPYVTYTADIMASPITVSAPEPVAWDAQALVFTIFRTVDLEMSEWKPGSPLSEVNAAAGHGAVKVPDDVRAVVRRGLEIGERTGGAFDITWAALWGLWDFTAESPRVPDGEAVDARAALVDYRRVVVDDEAGTVALPEEGMLIGLGGIAKGYALDRAAAGLRARGIDEFLVSAAGQVMAGHRRDGRPWRVGVRDPRGAADDAFAVLEVTDTSVSTSGDYERYFMQDGVRYHHVLDPRTGRPARGVRSATVVCADATLADALSTALMVLGVERGIDLADSWPGVEAVLVDGRGGVHMTSGLEGRLRMLHLPRAE